MNDQPTLSRVDLHIRAGSGDDRRSTAAYLVHQAVADLFGDRADRGYLYRVLTVREPLQRVLVLSTEPPLPLSALRGPDHRRVLAVESKPYSPTLAPGQRLDYEVQLNAACIETKGGQKRRVDIWEALWQRDRQTPRTPAEVYGRYLAGKLAGAATVLAAHVTARGELEARRAGRDDVARFIATNLIGTLEVHDPARLLALIATGVGRAKAFGCGLLCLSRPGSLLPRHHTTGH